MAALFQKEKVFLFGFIWQKCHKVSENIGEFSHSHYSTWDKKCPAKFCDTTEKASNHRYLLDCLQVKADIYDWKSLRRKRIRMATPCE